MSQIPNIPPSNPDYVPPERKKFETYPTLPGQNYPFQQPQYPYGQIPSSASQQFAPPSNNSERSEFSSKPKLTSNPSAPSFNDINDNETQTVHSQYPNQNITYPNINQNDPSTVQSQYPNQNVGYPNIMPMNGQMPYYPIMNQGQNVAPPINNPINNRVTPIVPPNVGVDQGNVGYPSHFNQNQIDSSQSSNIAGYPSHFNQMTNQTNSTENTAWNSNLEVGQVVAPDENIYDSQGNLIRKRPTFSNTDKDSWAIVNPTELPNKTDVDSLGNSNDEQISKRNSLFTKLKNSKSIKVSHFRDRGLTKFEIKIDNGNFIDMQGAEKDQMLNGFSLKLMTLGIVNTRFAIDINDENGKRVLQILRRVGSSDTVEIRQNLTGKKDDYITIGYITPRGLGNLTRVEYILRNDNKDKIGSVTSGALRGLFSDDFTLNYKKDELAKLKRNGLIQFTKKANNMGLGNKLLTIACVMLIKFNV